MICKKTCFDADEWRHWEKVYGDVVRDQVVLGRCAVFEGFFGE